MDDILRSRQYIYHHFHNGNFNLNILHIYFHADNIRFNNSCNFSSQDIKYIQTCIFYTFLV